MTDPLAQFRRRPAGSAPSTTVAESEGYIAFGAKDSVRRLRIRRISAPTRAPVYRDLWDVSYDGTFGTNFVLTYAFMAVFVRGRNLQLVITALESDMADFIQEFDPERWEMPKDPGAPFIESIHILMADTAPGLEATEKGPGSPVPPRKPH